MDFQYYGHVEKIPMFLKIQAEIFADGNDIMTEIWLKIRKGGQAGLAMRGIYLGCVMSSENSL